MDTLKYSKHLGGKTFKMGMKLLTHHSTLDLQLISYFSEILVRYGIDMGGYLSLSLPEKL